jgi:long-subunit acyl-CoA synthetase (AMP-forming)
MSVTRTSTVRSSSDHFQPEMSDDPQAQRRLRGQLEQIDYTAFIANREAIAATLGQVSAARFEKLAIATARARAEWTAAALALADTGRALSAAESNALTLMRETFMELSEAYEALRRMVERGYLTYEPAVPTDAA